MNIIELILEHAFVRYALIVGVLVAACSSLLGVTLVLKRYSYIGDGLSHVAFGGVAVASVLNLSDNLYIVMPLTVIASIVLIGRKKKIGGDSALAMLSVSSLAIGYLLLNAFPGGSGNISGDVCTSLFGATAILTLNSTDLILTLVMSVIVITLFAIFYNSVFAVTFDEDFSGATGVNTAVYRIAMAVISGVVISISMRLVGSLLVSALVVFPAMSAMKLFSSFKGVTVASLVIAVTASLLGMLAAIAFDTPFGATVVAADAIVYVVVSVVSKFAVKRV